MERAGPDRDQQSRLAAKRLMILDFIEGRLTATRFTRDYWPGEAGALRERVEVARERYQKLR